MITSDREGTLALNQALQRESEARREFMRVLKIYTALVTKGTAPPEGPE